MKIVALCILGSVMCILLRQSNRGEMALMTALAVSMVALDFAFGEIMGIVEVLEKLAEDTGLDSGIYKTVLKITGIAYITQTASELCRDSGEGALSGKVELCGKILICSSALPAVTSLVKVISEIM